MCRIVENGLETIQYRYFYMEFNQYEASISQLEATLCDVKKDFQSFCEVYNSIVEEKTIPPLPTTIYNEAISDLSITFQKINRSIYKLLRQSELWEKAIRNDYSIHSILLQNRNMELESIIQYGHNRMFQLLNYDKIEIILVKNEIKTFFANANQLNIKLNASMNLRKEAVRRRLRLPTLYAAINKKCEDIISNCELIKPKLYGLSRALSNSISSLQSERDMLKSKINASTEGRFCKCGTRLTDSGKCPQCEGDHNI